MADNQTNNNNSDEIDLGQLFQFIGKGFDKFFLGIIRVFIYLKKNILFLFGLLVIGIVLSYLANRNSSTNYKTEVIVKPTLESKNYLYDVIDEIQANIKSKNLDFFKELGLSLEDVDYFSISIASVDDGKKSSENEMKFLKLLQSIENTNAIEDILSLIHI